MGLNDIIHFWPYWLILSRSFCSDFWMLFIFDGVYEECREVSSAKSRVLLAVISASSFK